MLVTGAAGFVGSHVARHCRELGMQVVGVDDLSGGFMSNVPGGVTFVKVRSQMGSAACRVVIP